MLELKNINVSFRSERQDKIFGHTRQQVLFDVSLAVKEGTCLGILGESGSGKSTMGRVLCGLLKPDSGEAVLDGVSVYASRAGRQNLQNKLSIVFQDYTTSANPRFRIRDIIGEGLTVQERREGKKLDRKAETSRLLELVGLPADFADRFPHELSGGQLQRVCIARAVACKPEIILFDEAISSLDGRSKNSFTRKRIFFWIFTAETGMKNWPRWYSFPVEPSKNWSRRPAGRHRLFRFPCGSVQQPKMDCIAGQHKKESLLCCWSEAEMAAGLPKRWKQIARMYSV